MNRLRSAFALYRALMRDARTPWIVKAAPWVAVLYVFWPVDLIPDLLPLLGILDDVGIAAFLLAMGMQLAPKGLRDELRRAIRR